MKVAIFFEAGNFSGGVYNLSMSTINSLNNKELSDIDLNILMLIEHYQPIIYFIVSIYKINYFLSDQYLYCSLDEVFLLLHLLVYFFYCSSSVNHASYSSTRLF